MSGLQTLTPNITPSGSGALTPKAVPQEFSQWISPEQRKEELDAKEREIEAKDKEWDELKAELDFVRANNIYGNRLALFFSFIGIFSLFVWFTQIISYYWKGEDTKKKKKKE